MSLNMIKKAIVALAATLVLSASAAVASGGGGPALKTQNWSFNGPMGTFDRAQVQRGYQVYSEVCAGCHSLKYVRFGNLLDIGFSEDQAKAVAAEFEAEDGPDDDGEMFMRPARLSDALPSPFANDKAARASNNGALPPDLSLMAKARVGGPDYIYSLLMGYTDAPAGHEVAEGMNYNAWFPGTQIAMAPPVSDDGIEYVDGTAGTADQQAKDVSAFLMWAAEPKLEDRHKTGLKTMIFLIILTFLFWLVKRRVWADAH
jgi:ubiquinol-cytochrome c reductase cytochrome c1 subunit